MFGLLLALVMATGCASQANTGAGNHASNLRPDLAMPAPGKSKVVFLRPGHFAWAVHFGVHDGERLVGRSSSSTYFAYECDPGHHVFSASMDNLAFLNADLLPDRIYYVRVKAVWGVNIAAVKMFALYPGSADFNWTEIPKTLAKMAPEKVTDKAVQHDAEGSKAYMERLKKYQDEAQNGGTILPEYGQTTSLFSP